MRHMAPTGVSPAMRADSWTKSLVILALLAGCDATGTDPRDLAATDEAWRFESPDDGYSCWDLDLDGDGVIGFGDFALLSDGFGTTTASGVVLDFAFFAAFAAQFGVTCDADADQSFEDSDGNDPFSAGCVAEYATADCSDEVSARHIDSCVSDETLREALAGPAGVCTDEHSTVDVDCVAACKGEGYLAGACDDGSGGLVELPHGDFDCFGEPVFAAHCRCFDDIWADTDDGDNPEEPGCLGHSQGTDCAGAELGGKDFCTSATGLAEAVVFAAYDNECEDSCCAGHDYLHHDCLELCGGPASCVETPITCYGVEETAATCQCHEFNEDDGAEDTDGGLDPGTPGCMGRFAGDPTCADEASVQEIAVDRCLNEDVLVEMTVFDGCGVPDEVQVNCAEYCLQQGEGWGHCSPGHEDVACFGAMAQPATCECVDVEWVADTEDGPEPEWPGCIQRFTTPGLQCGGAFFNRHYDYCGYAPDGEASKILHDIHVLTAQDGVEVACDAGQCCSVMETEEIDCDAYCVGLGLTGGVCQPVPHECAGDDSVPSAICVCNADPST